MLIDYMGGQGILGVSPTTKLNKMNASERLNKAQKRRQENSAVWIRCGRVNRERLKTNCKALEGVGFFLTLWIQSSPATFKKQKLEISDGEILISLCKKDNIEDQTVAPYSEQGLGALHSKNLENEWTAVYFNLKKNKY